jgi:endonuclease/exonuclease/phosphatase family metal-dependent hydrolase
VLSRFPVTSQRTVALPYNPGGRREPRSAVAITCELPGGDEIVFIGTHLDHTGDEASDRLAQAKAINEQWRDERRPAILAGDINCEVGSPPMDELSRQWTRVSGPQLTSPAHHPVKTIDHVLVKPQERWKVVETHVIEEPIASDHRPVVVELELLPK